MRSIQATHGLHRPLPFLYLKYMLSRKKKIGLAKRHAYGSIVKWEDVKKDALKQTVYWKKDIYKKKGGGGDVI